MLAGEPGFGLNISAHIEFTELLTINFTPPGNSRIRNMAQGRPHFSRGYSPERVKRVKVLKTVSTVRIFFIDNNMYLPNFSKQVLGNFEI
jgi:hypothetical protein